MAKHVEDAAGIDDHEGNRQAHGRQHDPKPRGDADQLDDAKVVFAFDGVEEGAGGEDPPRVTIASLISHPMSAWRAQWRETNRKIGSSGRVVRKILL